MEFRILLLDVALLMFAWAATAIPTASDIFSNSSTSIFSDSNATSSAKSSSFNVSLPSEGPYYYLTADPSLSSYCESLFLDFSETYVTQYTTGGYTGISILGPTIGTVTTDGVTYPLISTTAETYYVETFTKVPLGPDNEWKASSPCCGSCSIEVGTIQFYYWPSSTTTAAVTNNQSEETTAISVDADGFTFTSPSVYMAFTTLYASDYCGLVGQAFSITTIAFDPSEITTQGALNWSCITQTTAPICSDFPPPKALDYANLQQNCSTLPGYFYVPQNPQNAQDDKNFYSDPCHPIIVIPTRVFNAQPAWATCATPFYGGAYDPPKTLKSVGALTQPAGPLTEPQPITQSRATNGPVITPPIPVQTSPFPATSPWGNTPSSPSDDPSTNNQHGASQTANSQSAVNQPVNTESPDQESAPPISSNTQTRDPETINSQFSSSQFTSSQSNAVQLSNSQPISTEIADGQVSSPSNNPANIYTSDAPLPTAVDPNDPEQGSSAVVNDPTTALASSSADLQQSSKSVIASKPSSQNSNGQDIPTAPDTIVGGVTASAVDSGYAVGGTILTPEAPPVTVDNTPISVGSSVVVIGDGTFALTSHDPPATSLPPSIGGQQISAVSGGIIAGNVNNPYGSQATVSGTPISAGTNNVIIDGSTFVSSVAISTPAATLPRIDGQNIQTAPDGGIIIGGSTFSPGAQITIAGTSVSIGISTIIIDGSAYTRAAATQTAAESALVLLGGSTISAGGPAATMSGTIISVLPDSGGVLIGSSTYALEIQTESNGNIVFPEGITISAGGAAATISGELVSILPGGEGVLVGSRTKSPVGMTVAPESVFTVAGQAFTANPTDFFIDGTSISQGGSAVTISGTVVSLGASGLQIGSSTVPLATPSSGLAGLILSGLGSTDPSVTPSASIVAFEGRAVEICVSKWIVGLVSILSIAAPGLVLYGLRA